MTAWLAGSAALLVVAAWSLLRPLPPLARALPGVFAVAALLLALALGLVPDGQDPVVRTLGVVAVGSVGVLCGSAVTGTVLGFAMRDDVRRGEHGGILVRRADEPVPARSEPEVLRGGAVIGYLERFAIVGAALVGHLEIVAAVIAIKGLGRFTELDSAAARERFIVGTLTSTCWAGLAAVAAVTLP